MNYWKEKWIESIKDVNYWIIVFCTIGEILTYHFVKNQMIRKPFLFLFFCGGVYGFFKVKDVLFNVPDDKKVVFKFKLLGIVFLGTIAFIFLFTVIALMIMVL